MQTCTPSGTWGPSTSCTSSQTCAAASGMDGGVGGACQGVCAPGQTQCDPQSQQQPQSCGPNGEWQNTGSSCQSESKQCISGSCQGTCSAGAQESCSQALGAKGNCANGQTICSANGTWGACSIQPAAQDNCTSGDDANCNGTPTEGCACVVGTGSGSKACGNCGSGTQACLGGQSPSGYAGCTGASGCNPGVDTQACTPSYSISGACINAEQTCSSTCSYSNQTCNANPAAFTPVANSYSVNPAAFEAYPSGPNCFGSTNNYGPWQLCPDGSTIVGTITCINLTGPNGKDGTCSVINQTSNTAELSVHANNNCAVGTSAQFNPWQCIPASCTVAP
jgi:hypothetical protein